MIESNREPYFTLDTETLGSSEKAIVSNIAMVFVDLPKIFAESMAIAKENGSEMPFHLFSPVEFIQRVQRIDLYPSLTEQRELGRTKEKYTIDFWIKCHDSAIESGDEKFLNYINRIMSPENRISVKEMVDEIHTFIDNGIEACLNTNGIRDKSIAFLERGGGFDTNKFYSLRRDVYPDSADNDSIYIPHWSRREIRSILSTNRWRDQGTFVKGTNWTPEFTTMVSNDLGGASRHMASFDAFIDAYGFYCLKMFNQDYYL